jgi:hypothetical protein
MMVLVIERAGKVRIQYEFAGEKRELVSTITRYDEEGELFTTSVIGIHDTYRINKKPAVDAVTGKTVIKLNGSFLTKDDDSSAATASASVVSVGSSSGSGSVPSTPSSQSS